MNKVDAFRKQRASYCGPTSPFLVDNFVDGLDYNSLASPQWAARTRKWAEIRDYNGSTACWLLGRSTLSDAQLYEEYCDALESMMSDPANGSTKPWDMAFPSLLESLIRVCQQGNMYFWELTPYNLDWWVAGRLASVSGDPLGDVYELEWRRFLDTFRDTKIPWYRCAKCWWGTSTWRQQVIRAAEDILFKNPVVPQ